MLSYFGAAQYQPILSKVHRMHSQGNCLSKTASLKEGKYVASGSLIAITSGQFRSADTTGNECMMAIALDRAMFKF